MAGRFKKILAFAAVAGAACAGIYYFFIRDTKGALEDGSGNKESEIKKFFEDIPSREYVPLSKGEADPEEEKAPEASD
ncbi:MAG: hypothetical protein K5931_03745, partial [Lachnospiraceae bacterium]|nr:hypothetical protein [Lachnospiraceae bacterium]